mmetsp:Transcript_14040/g.21264  ORF Transcript_14040/g.21264 Transcript_14040/m.21264 type:complete len:133 (+) Transcript_14040:90-488(+)|eukprot:CAMPEP_0167742762 /NCGR_PEP_ID=MMETSP0110_2-20121227/1624_1 /TAXON_ID=629695 /ORGANISM="Gymnochlora sp., Strain CCMP2014" /LENGTH=132 /DNA_ID=CAMNT_0007627025 /DNA_START=18 /DNA_END=416 /DNA_ORIENTATION=-
MTIKSTLEASSPPKSDDRNVNFSESSTWLHTPTESKCYPPTATRPNVVFLTGMPARFSLAQFRLLVFPCGKVSSLQLYESDIPGNTSGFVEFSEEQGARSAVKLLHLRNLGGNQLSACLTQMISAESKRSSP